ncbi:MAG: SagB/ThcOx family dehydrogenase [Bacillota bacterium]
MRALLPLFSCLFLGIALLFPTCTFPAGNLQDLGNDRLEKIKLPPSALESDYSLEKAIFERISRRSFSERPLALEQVAQLLWAAQGTGVDGVTGASRTAPSAGATYPIEIYVVAGGVDGLEPGVYRYDYVDHSIVKVTPGDRREKLAAAALNQHFVVSAPASIVLAADYGRTTSRYGERGIRYVHMEVGHIAQNIYLQCGSLNLGAVAVGAFHDERVKLLLEIEEEPLMIIPVGEISSR